MTGLSPSGKPAIRTLLCVCQAPPIPESIPMYPSGTLTTGKAAAGYQCPSCRGWKTVR